jgi:hypothetical protein
VKYQELMKRPLKLMKRPLKMTKRPIGGVDGDGEADARRQDEELDRPATAI